MRTQAFDEVFEALRQILESYAGRPGFVHEARDGHYVIASCTKTDRAGRPLPIAWVATAKNYVGYHLMPIYMNPALLALVSPALKKRMQGKSCFNFTSVDDAHLRELTDLTARGIAGFKNVKLPWEGTKEKGRAAKATRPLNRS